MICPNCKKEIENGSTFCEHCGTRVKKSKKGLWITLLIVFVLIAGVVLLFTQNKQSTVYEFPQNKQSTVCDTVCFTSYVDLGLPSGTLWKELNEGGDYAYYTFDEAINKFGNKLPTKQQLEELISKCTWRWIGNGYKVIGPNGNSIILPAAGSRDYDSDNVSHVGTNANYWSSTLYSSNSAWDLLLCATYGASMGYNYRDFGFSVRLVR